MVDRLSKPTAVLFDWDNTLVNTFPIIYQGLRDAFVAMDMEPWTFEDVKGNKGGIHHSLRESFPRIFGDRWEEARDVYFKSFLDNHLQKMEVIEGAVDSLDELAKKNIYVGIVSNKTGKHLRTEVEFLGWNSYFDKIVGATDAEKDKPHADPVHLVLDGTDIVIDENVFLIGDSSTDVECAINAGIMPVIFGEHIFEQQHNNDTIDLTSFPHVKNHAELKALFERF